MSHALDRAPSVLLVVHALPPEENSGTPLVTHGYAETLGGAGWDVTVLSASANARPWALARRSREPFEPFTRLEVPTDFGSGSSWLDAWSEPRTPSTPIGTVVQVTRTLERIRPDIVHVVDNVFLPLCIPEIAHEMGMSVVRSVSCAEDLCALVVPVSPCSGPSGYCEPPLSTEHCACCVTELEGAHLLDRFRPTGIAHVDAQRQVELRTLLGAQRARAVHQFRSVFDMVLFASEKFRSYFEQTLPLDPMRTRVVPMGVDVPVIDGDSVSNAPGAGAGAGRVEPITFLVAGNAHSAKGADAIVSAFTHPEVAQRDDWRLLLAGGGERRLYGRLLEDDRVRDEGPYEPQDLVTLCAHADIGISASVFETFHRVTREYLSRGVPVIGSTAFGISDAIMDGSNGLLFDHTDGTSLRRAVQRVLDDQELLTRLRRGARTTKVRRVAEEVEEISSLYGELIARRSSLVGPVPLPDRRMPAAERSR